MPRAKLTSGKAAELLHLQTDEESQEQGLLAQVGVVYEQLPVEEVSLDRIVANPFQPREASSFNAEELDGLAASMRAHGFYGHLLVRQRGRKYEIAYGERRLRAAGIAGLTSVPVKVQDLSDLEMLELSITENVQRQDLTPLEEGRSYARLVQMGRSQRELASRLGKSESHVSRYVALTQVPAEVQQAVHGGRLGILEALEIAKVQDEGARLDLIERMAAGVLDRLGLRREVARILASQAEAAVQAAQVAESRVEQVDADEAAAWPTADEAAARMGVSVRTVRRMLAPEGAGGQRLVGRKVDGVWRVDPATIEQPLEAPAPALAPRVVPQVQKVLGQLQRVDLSTISEEEHAAVAEVAERLAAEARRLEDAGASRHRQSETRFLVRASQALTRFDLTRLTPDERAEARGLLKGIAERASGLLAQVAESAPVQGQVQGQQEQGEDFAKES